MKSRKLGKGTMGWGSLYPNGMHLQESRVHKERVLKFLGKYMCGAESLLGWV